MGLAPTLALAQPAFWPLSLILFLPAIVAALLALPLIPRVKDETIRWIGLTATIVVFVLSLWMAWPTLFGAAGPRMRDKTMMTPGTVTFAKKAPTMPLSVDGLRPVL